MKYLVTVKITNEWTIEVSAKDEEAAGEKAQAAWDKIYEYANPMPDLNKVGKFDHQDEDIEFEVEESE